MAKPNFLFAIRLLLPLLLWSIPFFSSAQNAEDGSAYFQVKVDFLEPLINRSGVVRFDYGRNRHLMGLVVGAGGYISEFDNQQFDTYQDKTVYRAGIEYQYFLSQKKQNRGFFIGGDMEIGGRTIESKVSDESVENIPVFTPGAWLGYLWKPIKKADLYVDLTIIHPRYTMGNIKKVDFQTVPTPYEPQNLFNFLGPWSIGWRF